MAAAVVADHGGLDGDEHDQHCSHDAGGESSRPAVAQREQGGEDHAASQPKQQQCGDGVLRERATSQPGLLDAEPLGVEQQLSAAVERADADRQLDDDRRPAGPDARALGVQRGAHAAAARSRSPSVSARLLMPSSIRRSITRLPGSMTSVWTIRTGRELLGSRSGSG